MKELYSFNVQQEAIEKIPYKRKTKKGEVEAFKNKKEKKQTRIVIEKPTVADIEKAEFFFGQKYNDYINSGFLTKAMLAKKMQAVGSSSSSLNEEVNKAVMEYLEAARVIEFYEGAKTITEDQQKKLDEAKKKFAENQMIVHEYESGVRGQYNQTAESKAEERMIEWFIFNFTFYEEEVDGKKDLFQLFDGVNFDEKRNFYLLLAEDEADIEEDSVLNVKGVFDGSFEKIARVVNIWYNKLGKNQKEIDEQLERIFG